MGVVLESSEGRGCLTVELTLATIITFTMDSEIR